MILMLSGAVLLACTPVAVDGDTIRCGSERIRMLGIDAPEMPGHCQRGRRCVPGDPIASRAALRDSLRGPVSIERVGRDRYGRTLAIVYAGGRNLNCSQLARSTAWYVGRWDDGGRIAAACLRAARARDWR